MERRRHQQAYKETAWRLLILLVIVLAVAVGALAIGTINDHQALHRANLALAKANVAIGKVVQQQASVHLQIENACRRLNVQRVLANREDASLYRLLRSAQAIGVSRMAQFLHAMKNSISVLAWTPLTDCLSASAQSGESYVTPSPIPFHVLRAPWSALDVRNARRTNPVGSIP